MTKFLKSDILLAVIKFVPVIIFGTITICFLIFTNFATEKWVEARIGATSVEMRMTQDYMKILQTKLDTLEKKVDNNLRISNEIRLMLIK